MENELSILLIRSLERGLFFNTMLSEMIMESNRIAQSGLLVEWCWAEEIGLGSLLDGSSLTLMSRVGNLLVWSP